MSDYAQRAHALATLLTQQGFTVEEKHYPATACDELDRHYVLATLDGERTEVQYHQRYPNGTPPQGRSEALRDRMAQAQRTVADG